MEGRNGRRGRRGKAKRLVGVVENNSENPLFVKKLYYDLENSKIHETNEYHIYIYIYIQHII